jgi:beta-glucosidase
LEPNESKTILFALDKNAFNFYDVGTREWVFEPGEFEVQVGASSRDIRLKDVITLTSGQSASLAARMAHPSETFPIDWVPDSDIDFTRMLGYEIPIPPTKTGLFDYDTLMRDIKTSTLGCRIYEFVMKAMERDMANPNDPIQLRIQHNMMDSMPLRGLVVFSRGMLNFDILDLLLSLMNGEFAYTKAICMAPALLLSWFIMRFFGVNSSV